MALDRMHIDIGEGSEGMLSSTVRQTCLKVWTRSDGSGAKPARARGYFTSLLTRGFCQLAGNVRLPSNCCAHFFEETWRHPCFPNEAALEEKKCKWLDVISPTISFFFLKKSYHSVLTNTHEKSILYYTTYMYIYFKVIVWQVMKSTC